MRTWPIALSCLATSCIWISSARESERLDQDTDGVPLSVDCNDADPATSSLTTTSPFPPDASEAPVPPNDTGLSDSSDTSETADTATASPPPIPSTALSCDDRTDGVFDIECQNADPRPICNGVPAEEYSGETLLDILPCRHPGFTDRLVQVGAWQGIHRVEVDEPTDVRVFLTVDPEIFPGGAESSEPHPYAALVANRSRSCSEATCALGTPLIEAGAIASTDPYVVSFTALPGEPWYVIASGPSGSYRLDVRCGEEGL